MTLKRKDVVYHPEYGLCVIDDIRDISVLRDDKPVMYTLVARQTLRIKTLCVERKEFKILPQEYFSKKDLLNYKTIEFLYEVIEDEDYPNNVEDIVNTVNEALEEFKI